MAPSLMLTRALQAHRMLLKLPPGIAVGFETSAISGVGNFYLLYIPKHLGLSHWGIPATST